MTVDVLMPCFALVVIGLTGWMIVKRYQTAMVLLMAGLSMIIFAVVCGVTGFLPKGMKSSGLIWFDVIDLLRSIAVKQVSGIGLLIMVAGGFASYMDRIGAARALVNVCITPLKSLSSPYLIMVFGYLIGQMLCMVIPSAAGLAMLLLVALYPILVGVGVSPVASAAVIVTCSGMAMGPGSGTSNLAARVAGMDPIIYFVQCQLPVVIPSLVIIAICHYFVQRYYDRRNDDVYMEENIKNTVEQKSVPVWYALLPPLPIALMIIFSPLTFSSIRLNTISALLLVWIAVVVLEMIRRREVKEVLKDGSCVFKSMGSMFTSIVALIICAEFFANGLKITGLIDALIVHAQNLGLGLNGMTVVLTGVVGIVSVLTGSGVGAFSSFAALAPDVASGLGGSAASFVNPMQLSCGIMRSISPVAGAMIAMAGAVGVTPVALIRRTFIPMMAGFVAVLLFNFLFIG